MFDRLLEIDDFVADLWKVHLKVKEEGYAQVWNGPEYLLVFALTTSVGALTWLVQVGLHGPHRPNNG